MQIYVKDPDGLVKFSVPIEKFGDFLENKNIVSEGFSKKGYPKYKCISSCRLTIGNSFCKYEMYIYENDTMILI